MRANFKQNSTLRCRNQESFYGRAPEEQNLIEGLFQRLREELTLVPRMPKRNILGEDGPTYLLAQAVLVREHALANAQARIADLRLRNVQIRPAPGGGSFLSGVSRFSATNPNRRRHHLLCHSKRQRRSRFSRHLHRFTVVPQGTPYPSTVDLGASSGGSFSNVNAGVAGGYSLLFKGSKVSSATMPDRSGQRSNLEAFTQVARAAIPRSSTTSTDEPPAGSEHHQVQSDNFAQEQANPIQKAEPGQDPRTGRTRRSNRFS